MFAGSRFQRRNTNQMTSEEHSRLKESQDFLNEGNYSSTHHVNRRNIGKIIQGKMQPEYSSSRD